MTKNGFSGFLVCFLGGEGGGVVTVLLFCLHKVFFYLIYNIPTCFKFLLELQLEGCLHLSLEIKVLCFHFTELNLESSHAPPIPFLFEKKRFQEQSDLKLLKINTFLHCQSCSVGPPLGNMTTTIGHFSAEVVA